MFFEITELATCSVFPSSARSVSSEKNLKLYLAHKITPLPHLLFYSLRGDYISRGGSLVLLFAQHQEIFWSCLCSQLIEIALYFFSQLTDHDSLILKWHFQKDKAFGPKNPTMLLTLVLLLSE